MGLFDEVMIANRLAEPKGMKDFGKVGTSLAGAEFGAGMGINPLQSTSDFLRTYATMQWVYTAVWQIQSNLSRLNLKFYTGQGEDKEEIVNPVYNIWNKPHPFESQFMFWATTWGSLELTGEFFWYVVRDNENAIPQQIIPLRSDRMRIIPDSQEYIKGYIHSINGVDIPFEPWEIFFMRYYHPTKDYRGMSPLEAAKNDIILDLNSTEWAKSFFKNGTRVSGILETQGTLDQEVFERTRKQFNETYPGASNAHKTVLLESGTTFKPISSSPADVEFVGQKKLTKAAVCSVFGVPPILMMDLSDSSVLQNTEIQNTLFWESTLTPKMIMLQQEINSELLPAFGIEGAYGEYDVSGIEALKENRESKEKRYWQGFGKAAVSPNEIRQDVFRKTPIDSPEMNATYLPVNLLPAGVVESGKLYGKITKGEGDEEKVRTAKWRVFVSRVVPLERKLTADIAKQFRELKKEVIKNFEKTKSITLIDGDLLIKYKNKTKDAGESLFDDIEWIEKFNKTAMPSIAAAIEMGGLKVLEDLLESTVYDITDPFVIQIIKDRLDLFGVNVVGTTRKQITKEISAGMNAGESIEDISKRLSKKFNQMEKSRAPRIARTEVVTGFNAGNMDGMRQSGVVDEHEWLTSRDGNVRETHEFAEDGSLMDGQRVKIGEDFPLVSAYTGWSRQYPSDYEERCTTLPVRKAEV